MGAYKHEQVYDYVSASNCMYISVVVSHVLRTSSSIMTAYG